MFDSILIAALPYCPRRQKLCTAFVEASDMLNDQPAARQNRHCDYEWQILTKKNKLMHTDRSKGQMSKGRVEI